MPKDPEQAVCTLLHIFDQFSRCPMKSYYIKKYFNNHTTGSEDISEFMLDIGKHKVRKDEKRLKKTVDGQFTSLRKACQKANCSWTKFPRFIQLTKPNKSSKCKFVSKLGTEEIENIREHMKSDKITFPLPDHKFSDQRFFCNSMKRAQRMYNVLPSMTHKISLSTYYQYRPKISNCKAKYHFGKAVVKDVKILGQ